MPTINKNIVLNNVFSKVNQEQIIDLLPIRKMSVISSFTINLFGISTNKILNISYRLSYNGGLKFSDWYSVFPTPINIPTKCDFVVQIKAQRTGSDESGVITIGSVDVSGDSSQAHDIELDFVGTLFEGIANDYWEKLWINLVKKLHSDGILPQFIDRGEDVNDDDLIDYITYVAKFYAFIGGVENKFIETFDEDKFLLSDFLRQKTSLFCSETTLQDLTHIKNNFIDEIRQRGTHMVHQKHSYSTDNGVTTKGINGELLRYICFEQGDEFLFEFLNSEQSGWSVDGITCPNFFSNTGRLQLNKSPNSTPDANLTGFMFSGDVEVVTYGDKYVSIDTNRDLLNTELSDKLLADSPDSNWQVFRINYTNTGIEVVEDAILLENSEQYLTQNNEVMILEESSAITSGSTSSLSILELLCDIDPAMSYELTFKVKSDAFLNAVTNNSFSVKCLTSDKNGVLTSTRLINSETNSTSQKFFIQSANLLNEKWLFVKCIIYSYDFDGVSIEDIKTNIGVGSNIQITDKNTSKVKFSIINDSISAEPIYIHDVKVTPLSLNNNSCFVDNYHTANLICKNNNRVESIETIIGNINKYLMPYNTNFNYQILKLKDDYNYLLSDTEGDFIITESGNKIFKNN